MRRETICRKEVPKMKNIGILGSTGSIGTQTLEVVRANPEFKVTALAAGGNIDLAGAADQRV